MAVDERLILSVQNQMLADPQVQQAYQRYRQDGSQASFTAWLDAARPYYDQVKSTGYGLDPTTGQFHKPTSSTKGAITKSILLPGAATVSAGMALPLGGAPSAVAPSVGGGAGALETPGTVNLGADVAGEATDAAGGFNWKSLLRWLPAVGSKAIDAVLQNRQANQRAEAERTRQAVVESELDPFRGYMNQAHDASRLDWMANQDLTSPPVQLDANYGRGITPRPTRDYGPSADTRALLRAASSQVAAGDTAPLITPGAQQLPVVKRKKNPNPDDPTSWLYQA